MGNEMSFIGRTQKNVFSKNKSIFMKALDKSILYPFCTASLLVAAKLGLNAINEMRKK